MNFMIFFKKEVRSDVLSSWTLVFTSPKSISNLGFVTRGRCGRSKTEYSFYKEEMPMSKNRAAPTTFASGMMKMKKTRIAAEGTTIK